MAVGVSNACEHAKNSESRVDWECLRPFLCGHLIWTSTTQQNRRHVAQIREAVVVAVCIGNVLPAMVDVLMMWA